MRDATFADRGITFRRLFNDTFTCVMRNDHPLVPTLTGKAAREGGISTKDVWDCRQILSIPSYLLKGFFSRGVRILPVNTALDNLILANANEAYSMVLAGFGYAMLPGHLLLSHPDLAFFPCWNPRPVPLGSITGRRAAQGRRRHRGLSEIGGARLSEDIKNCLRRPHEVCRRQIYPIISFQSSGRYPTKAFFPSRTIGWRRSSGCSSTFSKRSSSERYCTRR